MTDVDNQHGSGSDDANDKEHENHHQGRLERPQMLSDYRLLSRKDLIGSGDGKQRGLIPISPSALKDWVDSGYFPEGRRYRGRRFWLWKDVREFIEQPPPPDDRASGGNSK